MSGSHAIGGLSLAKAVWPAEKEEGCLGSGTEEIDNCCFIHHLLTLVT